MPQIGFFVGTAGIGIGGIPLGVANVILAWDAFNVGVGSSLGLVYKTLTSSNAVGGGRLRNYKPIPVATYRGSGTTSPLGHGNIVRFALAGHTNYGSWVDLTLKVFDQDGKQLYSAADGSGQDTIRVQVTGFSTSSSLNFEDTFENIHDTDNAIFNALMTTGGSIWGTDND